MKESKYNIILKIDRNKYAIFNTLTGALAIMSESNYKCLCDWQNCNAEISDKRFMEGLLYGGFIIEDSFNEINSLKFKMLKSRFNTDTLALTIAPTSDCNFRCTYCYEKDSFKFPPMQKNVQDAIMRFVQEKIETINRFSITWYGGEPLLCFDIIERMSKSFKEMCQKNSVKYGAGIITNGYLLSKDVCSKFPELSINSVQVTLDGDQEQHDSRRPLKNGQGSFSMIIENLKQCKGVLPYKIALRVNIDKKNSSAIEKVSSIIRNEGLEDTVFPYLAKVHPSNGCCVDTDCYNTEDFSDIFYQFEKERGNDLFSLYPKLRSNYCGADAINSFVIDAEGNLYKCWNDIGFPQRVVGSLVNNESAINNNSVLIDYLLYDVSEDSECAQCRFLPLCMGGCPSKRLQGLDRCEQVKHYLKEYLSDVLKQELLKGGEIS